MKTSYSPNRKYPLQRYGFPISPTANLSYRVFLRATAWMLNMTIMATEMNMTIICEYLTALCGNKSVDVYYKQCRKRLTVELHASVWWFRHVLTSSCRSFWTLPLRAFLASWSYMFSQCGIKLHVPASRVHWIIMLLSDKVCVSHWKSPVPKLVRFMMKAARLAPKTDRHASITKPTQNRRRG